MKFYALVLVAALNPLVMRTPEPHGNVPADCVAGDDAPLPRIVARNPDAPAAVEPEAEEAPLPRVAVPGSTATRYDLRALQNAIARNDRAAFDAELANAKAGGAQVRVYDDVARLWDAQFEAPFFAEGSPAHRIASQYPGYEAAVRTQVFTDAGGKKFYPAAESRAFVAKQAGVTLASTGRVAKSPTNVSIAPTPKPRTPSTKTSGKQPDTRATRQPSRQPSNRATKQPSNRSTTQPRKTVPRDPAPPSPSPDPSAARVAAATEPAPVVPQVGDTSSTQAPSAAGSLPPTETTATDTMATDTMATDTMVTDTGGTDTAATIDTAVTATDVPATTTGAPAKTPRRIILPALLILIGLGVLILLFRAR